MARIVVADDDADIRDLVVFKLRQSGHDVHPVADGAAAVEECQSVTPDLVVLDVMMPGMGGLDACRALRQDPALARVLSRALLNLLSNAVKFSHDDGLVTVRVRQAGADVTVEVADAGIGIPAGDMGNLATRFFRAANAVDAEISGTGLGLRIVHTIMDNHGGRLEVESVEGEGTTARMVLPLSAVVVPAAVRRVHEALEAVREREENTPADR